MKSKRTTVNVSLKVKIKIILKKVFFGEFHIVTYSTIAGAVLFAVLAYAWNYHTRNLYSYEILAVKEYYGKLNNKSDEDAGLYFFVKMKFSKRWFQAKAEIYPRLFTLYDNEKKRLATFDIVAPIDPKTTEAPLIRKLPTPISNNMPLTSIVKSESDLCWKYVESYLYIEADGVGKIMGDYKKAEDFGVLDSKLVQIPFELERGEEEVKLFVFKLSRYEKKNGYSTLNPNLYYNITGKHINTDKYQFVAYFKLYTTFDGLKKEANYLGFFQRALDLVKNNENKTAMECIKCVDILDPGNPIKKAYEGIIDVYSGKYLSGNELIKNNLCILPNVYREKTFAEAIKANIFVNQIPTAEQYLNESLREFPYSLILNNLKAITFVSKKRFNEAFEVYEKMRDGYSFSKYAYHVAKNKGIILMLMNDYKYANYYLIETLRYIEQNDYNEELISMLNCLVGVNYWRYGEKELGKLHLQKVSSKSHFYKAAQATLKNIKPALNIPIGFLFF